MAVDGDWKIKVHTPLGVREGTLSLKTEGTALTGTQSSDDGSQPIENGKVSGDTITWTSKISKPMAMTLECSAKVTGDTMAGEVKLGMMGKAKLEGVRA